MKSLINLIQNSLKLPFDIFPLPKTTLYPLDEIVGLYEEDLDEFLSRTVSPGNLDNAYLFGTEPAARDLLLTMGKFDWFDKIEPGYFFIGHWGYGVNSYSFYYVFFDGSYQVYFRLPLGGAYSNLDEDISEIHAFLSSFFSYYPWIKDNSLQFTAINIMGYESYKIKLKNNRFIESDKWKNFTFLLPEFARSCYNG